MRTTGPWLAMATAILVLSPNLVWNAQNEWINYAFQVKRSGLSESGTHPLNVGIFVAGAAVALSPLVLVAAGRATWHGLRSFRDDDRVLFLLAAGLPLPLLLGLLSFFVKISVHWPSCGYVPLLILAVHYLGRGEILGPRFRVWMWRTAVASAALLYVAPVAINVIPAPAVASTQGHASFSYGRLKQYFHGWRPIAERIAEIHDEMKLDGPTLLMGEKWSFTAMLGFYAARPRECFAFDGDEAHNYEIWLGQRGGFVGHDALVAVENKTPNRPFARLWTKYRRHSKPLRTLFERIEKVPSIIFYDDGTLSEALAPDVPRPRAREILLFKCYGFKGELLPPGR